MSDIWFSQPGSHINMLIPVVKQRLLDIFKQECDSFFTSSSKCILFKYVVDNMCLQTYLSKPISTKYKKEITKLRLSSHNLLIETGRHKKIPRELRICPLCHVEVEDEFHYVLKCSIFNDLRRKYIKIYYRHNPSVFKLIQLLSTDNVKDLCNLGKYAYNANILRSNVRIIQF